MFHGKVLKSCLFIFEDVSFAEVSRCLVVGLDLLD